MVLHNGSGSVEVVQVCKHVNRRQRADSFGLREIVNEFAEETGIFGPSILRSGLSGAEAVFWILCALFFSCCTVRDLANLTRSYLQEGTVSLVSQKTTSTFFLRPAPTVAIQHGLDRATFDFRHLPTKEKLDEMLDAFLGEFENTTAAEEGQDVKVPPSIANSALLTDLMATMLHEITASESPTIFAAFDTATYGTLERESSFATVQPFIEQAFRRLRSRNIDFSKLRKLVIAVLCARADFSVTCCYYPGAEPISPCTSSNVLSFDDVYLSFRLSKADFTFTGPEDSALISWNAASPIGTTFSPAVVVDLSGSPQTVWENENSLTRISYDGRRGGEHFVISFALSTVFLQAKGKTLEPCSTTISLYDCKQQCYINRFVKQCGCYPLYFAAAYPPPHSVTFPLCPNAPMNDNGTIAGRIIDYVVNCSRVNASEARQRDNLCQSQCLPDCRTRTFVTATEQEPPNNGSRNELELKVATFTFPVFEEKLAMNFESFISQFGGILGLYIGISFAALVHVPVFAIRKALQRFRRPGSAAKCRANTDEPSHDSHILEISSIASQSADISGPSTRYERVHNEQLEQRVSALELEVQSLVDAVKSLHKRFSAE